MAEPTKTLVQKKFLASLFGVSTRRIDQLKEEGIIEGEGKPTKYDLLPTIKVYIKYLSDKAHGREKKEEAETLEQQKLSADSRLKNAKADMAELELEEMRGTLHSAEDVEAVMTDHVLLLRSMILALPGRLAVDVSNAKTPAEAADIIKKECTAMLEQLASYEYDPDEYQKRVRERYGLSEIVDGVSEDEQ